MDAAEITIGQGYRRISRPVHFLLGVDCIIYVSTYRMEWFLSTEKSYSRHGNGRRSWAVNTIAQTILSHESQAFDAVTL